MNDDTGFLEKLLADPSDNATRLVYADWLEEQGDPVSEGKAEFLRLTVRAEGDAAGKRLQQLAAGLDTDWLAVASRLSIENCQREQEDPVSQVTSSRSRSRRKSGRMRMVSFSFLCPLRWEDLRATGDRAVRFCDACGQNVHYCDTITEARQHARDGHCIAVDLGVIRRDGDLDPPLGAFLGLPSREMLLQEKERMQPDPVSAERERRKREGGESHAT
jgi:uncharacterized protein (TIGR02996 family)